ncbi:alcohol dehydrogenase family protein [Halofilum ochraceum]|uniref:alcohol dehydrogenase family protein n=1 Tax=Halofilum ochraceum TaxID=1611323 RepID=UPI0008321669|nr:alcohol dehydrogenase family protein [Halofilum ochraceum]
MPAQLPDTMAAVQLTGHGGMDKLAYREDIPVPRPGAGEILIRVAAAGVNNTDINTRIGWYSKRVRGDTNTGSAAGFEEAETEDATWSGVPLQFPRIQGTDCCGRIVAVGDGVDPSRVGERVLVRNMLRAPVDFRPYECWSLGSECDGGFAQYTKAPAADTWTVDCDWSDTDLASIPCAWSTAENMLHRARVGPGDRVIITGASGGVGSAAVQLAKCRGAEVIGVAGAAKSEEILALGADRVLPRGENLVEALGAGSVNVAIDLVVGEQWAELIEVLDRGGRYATAGAIAGPVVELDVRTLYLKDLTFYGCTFQEDVVFDNVVRYIEQGRVRPFVARTYPLSDIAQAQEDFIAKRYAGKLVLVPPQSPC